MAVEKKSLTKVDIRVKMGDTRKVGIRTIVTDVALDLQPSAPTKGEWLMSRENLVHRDTRPRDMSFLRLSAVFAAFLSAIAWAAKRDLP